ncbi:MAG: hypothetical protein ACI4GB_09750 [Acutalibacteraceae bacterium]
MKKAKKMLCLLLAVLITAVAASPMAFAAVTYPQNVTKEQSLTAIKKTDTALEALVRNTQNQSLKDLVLPKIYSDEILSSMTVEIYKMIEENADSISSIGLDVTVGGVAACLGGYPDVAARLSGVQKWSDADLSGARWGVSDREGFLTAMGCIFAPFNELLYTLLCSGTYPLNSIIAIEGANGYETAIVPTLRSLGCGSITGSAEFYARAKQNKNTMIENIAGDVMLLLEDILDAPCDRLTDILPGIAYFLNNGGFDKAVSTLIEPLRLQLFNISTFIKIETVLSFIGNSESYTQNFTGNFNDILGATGLKMADIDLELLASCGTVSGDTVTADKADTFIVLMRWLIDTLKLNKDNMGDLMGEQDPQMTEMLGKITEKPTDELLAFFIGLFSAEGGKVKDYQWTFTPNQPVQVSYTPNLGQEKYKRVLDGIDSLIDEFVAEGGEEKTLEEMLKKKIYSPATLTTLVKEIYGMLSGDDMAQLAEMIGLKVTPSALAAELKESSFAGTRKVLNRYSSWKALGNTYVPWGFSSGDKAGFIKAASAALRPLEPMLNMLLAEGKIELLGAVEIYGSNGYNTAVIPLLEAFGCSQDSIMTYGEFKAAAEKGNGAKALVTAVCSLVDRFMKKPVYTLTEILPNLVYFVQSGSVKICVDNLIYPFKDMLEKLGMSDVLDLSKIENIDLKELMGSMTENMDLGMKLPELDLAQFSGMGQTVTVESKRTYAGAPAQISYVKADQTAVLITFLRYLVEVMKTPGNENLMTGFMGGSGDNAMFDTYASGIGEEMAAMSVDETVEWLYKLFFRERAVVEEKPDDNYLPTVIYVPAEQKGEGAWIYAVFGVAALAEVLLLKNREKISMFLEDRKFKKQSKKEKNPQEA